MANEPDETFDVIVIGTGFGGTMTALTIAEKLNAKSKPRIRMLERGTWWTTPVSTVQDKPRATYTFLKKTEPVQFWSSAEHLKGFIDIITRCIRRPGNEDGLYDMGQLGRKPLLGLFGGQNDGVSILRACGVGGGSLVYSNITVRPPEFIFQDPAWARITWNKQDRDTYFRRARHAIGYGVVSSWTFQPHQLPFKNEDGKTPRPPGTPNAGLSNIATRSALLNADFEVVTDPQEAGHKLKRLRLPASPPPPAASAAEFDLDPKDTRRYWIDRARIFQTAISGITDHFGTVDSSINDLVADDPLGGLRRDPSNYPSVPPVNYCERQGRCTIGCLPGARHTLNKQLMGAILGTPPPTNAKPLFPNMSLKALTEVDTIHALADGGYEVRYHKRDTNNPSLTTPGRIRAKRVIVAAGCLGTNEILLRSRESGGLPHLSQRLGHGFSTNGDYIAFTEELPYKVSLSRGPVQTSYAHFNDDPNDAKVNSQFHIVEDQGIPRALASTVGFGVPLIRSLSNGRHRQPKFLLIWTLVLWAWCRLLSLIRALFQNSKVRQKEFESEDEMTDNMMCITASGRDQATGVFSLGTHGRDTPLRVSRPVPFHKDPIFERIRETLEKFRQRLGAGKPFMNPFLTKAADSLKSKSIVLSHPLGGCAIGTSVADGVVDELGRVFDASKSGSDAFYPGLYIADASIFPAALGVNPSLTISALALRIGEAIANEMLGES